ncbi:MAG TPA: PVC-type heme-binding CxxCH protein [Verrucomicrobiales bacterium]|nr:PVC-type heme-binding CxxCH protein [Verrucomicrobiales bacterium]
MPFRHALCLTFAALSVSVPAQEPSDPRPHESPEPALSPEESAKHFTLADGLAIDLVLSEPLVTQPLHISFDSRGRLWLVEARQYPKPAGLKEVAKDKVWRAIYDKVPPPPPFAADSPFRGTDRISIHEDKDGDGVYETHKVFLDGLNMATSVAHTEHGIWVTHAPYLLFYPDKNQDDVPDGPPEVHLSGFGLEDTHSIANSLRWGPDGWLYGAQGSTVSAAVLVPGGKSQAPTGDHWPEIQKELLKQDSQAVKTMGQNIWRYHPPTRRYEIFAEGGGNAYGLEIDSKGRIFSGHNGGDTRGFHYVQGGYYQKGWEKHGELSNPYAFGYFPPMKNERVERFTHQFIIYESDALAEQWRGKLWGCDVLHNNIVCSEMIPEGSTFRSKDVGRPVASTDKWFRPVMITDGPDGCLYICDWCDKQVSHFRNQMGVMDKEHGRVWRVRMKDNSKPTRTLPTQDVAGKLPDNRWLRQTFLRLAWEKRWHTPRFNPLDDFWSDVARAAPVDMMGALVSADPSIQTWAIRLLGDDPNADRKLLRYIGVLADCANKPEVNVQIAATARRMAQTGFGPVIATGLLLNRSCQVDDPLLPLMIWWAFEDAISRDSDFALKIWTDATSVELWNTPIARKFIIERLMKRFAITGKREDFLRCSQLLKAAPNDECRQLLMKGFSDAMKGRSLSGLPDELLEQLAKTGGPLALALRVRQQDRKAVGEALAILSDGKNPKSNPASRETLAAVFADIEEPQAVPVLLNLLSEAPLRRVTLAALQRQRENVIAERLLKELPAWPAADKEAALTVLASRAAWAPALVKSGIDLPLAIVKKLQLFPDKELGDLITAKYAEKLKAAGGEKEKEIQRVKSLLAGAEGIPKKGEVLFQQRCASCHMLWNKGGKVGPDLTSYQRTDLDMLLLAMVAPSAEIREGYTTTVVETKDGSTLAGFITDQDKSVLVLRDPAGQTQTITRSRIAKEQALPFSLMPEGLLAGLADQEIRDLFAWIRSTTPPF